MNIKKYRILLLGLLIMLYGCGSTDKLDAYYDGMSSFNSNVMIIAETLELIDEGSDSAVNQVCTQLDKMVEQFRIMSELEVPKKFEGCEELGDDAYTYIQEASRLYKEWAGNDDADDQLVNMARENYNRAMERVNVISVILQGRVPEGDGLTVTEEEMTDFTPVTQEETTEDNQVIEEIELIEE